MKDVYEEREKQPEAERGEAPPKPGEAPKWEVLYDTGSWGGLGKQMMENNGRAFLMKHEGKQWFANMFQSQSPFLNLGIICSRSRPNSE